MKEKFTLSMTQAKQVADTAYQVANYMILFG